MATLTVSVTHDFSGDSLSAVGLIDFVNPASPATATFASSQFDNAKILTTVTIDGSVAINHVLVSGGSVNASGWTFTNWLATDLVSLAGGGGADAITGSSQNDTITGGAGADTMVGGAGNDTFVYNSANEFAAGETIDGGAGTGDVLRISIGTGFTLFFDEGNVLSGVEKVVFDEGGGLALPGSGVGTGAGQVNSLTGSAGVNKFLVTESHADLSGVTFTNWTGGEDTILIAGTSGNDVLVGSGERDDFIYTGGKDRLSGGGGDDDFNLTPGVFAAGCFIDGGGGSADRIVAAINDFSVGTITGVEQLLLLGGIVDTSVTLGSSQLRAGAISLVTAGFTADTLIVKGTSVDLSGVTIANWTAGVDRLIINGDALADNALTGSSVDDIINGGSGRDTMNGGAGLDVLNGGLGDDTYVLGAEVGDTITEAGGTDTITTTVSRSLAGFGAIENLTLLGSAAVATGNGLANTLIGNGVANVLNGEGGGDTLDGRGGADTMRGGAGDDAYIVDNAGDVVDESVAGSGGADVVRAAVSYSLATGALGAVEALILTGAAPNGTGNAFANTITGNAAANVLDGGDGDDRLVGGAGADDLIGGAGADTFAFLALGDTGKKKAGLDAILDFGVDDFIDLSAIDARKGGADNRFKFIGTQGFHDKKGELHYDRKKGDVIVSGDVNGDGKADFAILVEGVKKLAKADFDL